jgi:hypothetical protein
MRVAPTLRAAALLLLLAGCVAQFGFDLAQVQGIVAQQTVRASPARALSSHRRLGSCALRAARHAH